MGPECEDPSDLDVDLRIIQLTGEGTVGGSWVPDTSTLLLPITGGVEGSG
jgi:hypothetical protein